MLQDIDDVARFLVNLAQLLRLMRFGAHIAAINAGLTVAFIIIVLWLRG